MAGNGSGFNDLDSHLNAVHFQEEIEVIEGKSLFVCG